METDFRTIKLGELFDDKELKQLTDLIKKNEWDNIRIFLNENNIKNKLEKKGVLADYLYYYLRYRMNGVNN